MKVLCVIPSRIGSTRLPRKPLLPIKGKPMVQWVYENAKKCSSLTEVVVATDHQEIADVILSTGGKIIMTPKDIATGSDRVAHVAKEFPDMEIIVNLQGDEPFIQPLMLDELIRPFFEETDVNMTTLAYPLDPASEYENPNIVKVLMDCKQNAIYFSRSPIPYFKNKITVPVYHHMGLYAFRRSFLMEYTNLPQTPLEKAEALEQLRAIENGYKIRVCLTESRTLEVNTQDEYELAQEFSPETA